MTSEYDNEETGDIVESETADSDDKTKTVSSVSELIPRHNAVSGIFWFQARDDPSCRHWHLKTRPATSSHPDKL